MFEERRTREFRGKCTVALLLASACLLVIGRIPAAGADDLEFRERVVAGGPSDFMEVRHLVLRGSNRAIGRKLAEIARQRHGVSDIASPAPLRSRARHAYIARDFPVYYERMRGAAEAFEVAVDDPRYDLLNLAYGLGTPACTVVFYPPKSTADGIGILSRNFDFTTGTFSFRPPGQGEVPVCSRPYIVELHPDEGYASIAIQCFDLLGGVVDGINSEGLSVALLADGYNSVHCDAEPAKGPAVGYGVLLILRKLLDTCANVEEAKLALLEAKLYVSAIPCHYVVADRHGDSFIWENSHFMNDGYVIDGNGGPQCSTNYQQHQYPDLSKTPGEEHPYGSFNRHRAVNAAAGRGGLSVKAIKEVNASVASRAPAGQGYALGRTLWHALYYPESRKMEVDFYLGEESAAGSSGATKHKSGSALLPGRRSGYLQFDLR